MRNTGHSVFANVDAGRSPVSEELTNRIGTDRISNMRQKPELHLIPTSTGKIENAVVILSTGVDFDFLVAGRELRIQAKPSR